METPEKKTTAEETAEEVVEETTAAEAEETVAEEAEETVRDAADTLSEEEEKLRIQLADINDRYVRLMAVRQLPQADLRGEERDLQPGHGRRVCRSLPHPRQLRAGL